MKITSNKSQPVETDEPAESPDNQIAVTTAAHEDKVAVTGADTDSSSLEGSKQTWVEKFHHALGQVDVTAIRLALTIVVLIDLWLFIAPKINSVL